MWLPPPTGAEEPEEGPGAPGVLDEVLAGLDGLQARMPVAYHLVALSESDDTCAADLGLVVSADPVLTARLLRLANSAYYGLSGRVSTTTFAVTVVGFTTVRSLALAAVTAASAGGDLPASYWTRATATAVAAGEVAPRLAVPTPDAFCVGLLASLGQGLLLGADRVPYLRLLCASPTRAALSAQERRRYGMAHTAVSAAALRAWSFPAFMVDALEEVSRPGRGVRSAGAVVLAVAEEVAARSVGRPAEESLDRLGAGRVPETMAAALVGRVREVSAELAAAFSC